MAGMPVRLQYRRYRLALRAPVRTAHEVWTERSGVVLRLEDSDGRIGFGEAAPIPAFGTETTDEIVDVVRGLGEYPSEASLADLPVRLLSLRSAVAAARMELTRGASEPAGMGESGTETAANYRGVAALLPAGRAALGQVEAKAETGFRVFKWKVGVEAAADELALLDDLCGQLPGGGKLRLDANGAWDRRTAERWLERCAERPIEFVEQPCFASSRQGESAVRRAEDTLLGLANDFPTPLALDESAVSGGDIGRWISAGWPGWYVLKPSLLGDPAAVLEKLERAKATVVFSSALETAVGARSALRVAFGWRGDAKALGFGVWPLFVDARFDGPASAPFVRREDVERINPEAIWNALT